MTQPRPTAEELVEAVRTFLADEVVPALEGRVQFHARVAANVLAIVERELRDGPAASTAETERLAALLDRDGSLDELNRELVERLRAGTLDPADPALLAHLRATAGADVAIANPRHATSPLDRS